MAEILGWGRDDYRCVAVYMGDKLPPPTEVKSVVITGAGVMVNDTASWITECTEWLARAVKAQIPILGICFGHQLLAQAIGGRVDKNPRGLEVGSITIHLTREASRDRLFNHMPDQFTANVSHTQSVLELPEGARLLAHSKREPVQAFGYGEQIWGVQFHPEFDGEIVAHFIHHYGRQLQREGRDVGPLLEGAVDTPESRALLKRFAQIYTKCEGE